MAAIAPITSLEYAAGTCTLRLTGQLSALSQLAAQPVLARSRFDLRLLAPIDAALAPPPSSPAQATVLWALSGREAQLSALANLIQTYVQGYLGGGDRLHPLTIGENSLQPVGLTRHRLTLGVPFSDTSASPIELSTLQLADLAEVLDQADQAVQRLPDGELVRPRQARPRLSLWLGSAAAVLVAAVLGQQWLVNPPPTVFSPAESPTEAELGQSGAAPESAPENIPENAPAQTFEADVSPNDSPTPTAAPEAAENPVPAGPQPTTPAPPGLSTPKQPAASAPPTETPPTASADRPSSVAPSTGSASPPLAVPYPDAAEAQPQARTAPPVAASAPEQSLAADGVEDMVSPEAAAARSPDPDWQATISRELQQGWAPPPGLREALRYTLTIQPDGEIVALVPGTEIARIYQNTPSLPKVGQVIPNLDAFDLTQPVTVEAQFLPSGAVLVGPSLDLENRP